MKAPNKLQTSEEKVPIWGIPLCCPQSQLMAAQKMLRSLPCKRFHSSGLMTARTSPGLDRLKQFLGWEDLGWGVWEVQNQGQQ